MRMPSESTGHAESENIGACGVGKGSLAVVQHRRTRFFFGRLGRKVVSGAATEGALLSSLCLWAVNRMRVQAGGASYDGV